MRPFAAALLSSLLLVGCFDRAQFVAGDGCMRTSECAAPLVCRLQRCRVECHDDRDCEGGAECVLDGLGLGACQLPDEMGCSLDSDCPMPLVCGDVGCINECEGDSDCRIGYACNSVGEAKVCQSTSSITCEIDSQCESAGAGSICAPDRFCRPGCAHHIDCEPFEHCDPMERRCVLGAPPPDAGL